MGYRKITSDRIFDGYRMRSGHTLVLSDDGTVAALLPSEEAGEAERVEGILSPGLVNCHCHLELSHMKGRIPEKTGLVDFVFKVVTERHHSEEEILSAIAAGEEEMIRNGIVAVGDICNNAMTVAQKKQGRMLYSNFIESSGWLPALAQTRFDRALELYRIYTGALADVKGHTSMVPHAPYSVSEALWQKLQPYFEGKTVSIHNQETFFEDEFFRSGSGDFERMYRLMKIDNSHHRPTGRSSLQSYFSQLESAAIVLLVHNTFTGQADIDEVRNASARTGQPVFFCLCPNANRYIEDALPPVQLLRRNDCAIVVGTDSLASNWQLSVLEELKTIHISFPDIQTEEMLRWVTSNGARALQLDGLIGSFEAGKKPGVVVIDDENWTAKVLVGISS